MYNDNPIELKKVLSALSLAMDFSKKGLMNHHQRVALLSLKIAEILKLSSKQRQELFLSAIIHDAGVSTWREKKKLEQIDIEDPWEHCQKGYELLKQLSIFNPLAEIILSHHDRWDGNNPSGLGNDNIPIQSRIIHLADRVDILTGKGSDILYRKDEIVKEIKALSRTIFDPDIVETFEYLAEKESTWLDLTSRFIENNLFLYTEQEFYMTQNELLQVSQMFARVIDGKSPYTYRHSKLVTEIAVLLAEKIKFNEQEIIDMRIAALLHDLGKLTIPDEILEKPGKLTGYEFSIIKQHTYYTHQILSMIEGLEKIKIWASYHHEKLDGSGYPFRINAGEQPLGARIIAVSDIYSALAENRPYRPGMPRDKVIEILDNQVNKQAIDGEVVDILKKNLTEAEKIVQNIGQ